jgi:GGDEF domain-containing protein
MHVSEKVWERIINRYEAINNRDERPYLISVSHGIAECINHNKPDVEALIKAADEKMYMEKKYIKEELKVKVVKDS